MQQALPLTLYSTADIKALEQCTIQEHGISGFELMSRAGYEVFQCLTKRWPHARSIAVVCGNGNNAGDGYIVAKLALATGLQVEVYVLADPENLKGDALTAYRQYLAVQGRIILFQPEQPISADVIVDALLGTGLDRPVSGLYKSAIDVINRSLNPVIAVDIPSGLSADTGNALTCAVRADCTVTFIGLKQGLFSGQAADYSGEIVYASLAVPDAVFRTIMPAAYRVVEKTWPRRPRYAHKGNNGHVLVIGGDAGYSGAARLAAEAALRVGAGLVSVATRAEHAALLSISRPELMCHSIETAEQLERLLARIDIIVLGPGLGQSAWAKELFAVAISAAIPLIVDADGLNLLAATPMKNARWILTPHPGEAARLLASSTMQIQEDRYTAARSIQSRYGGIAILKGVGTLIASGHDLAVAGTGNPGMATGGMGDVLAGVIAGLLAQDFSVADAAQQGVYIHGAAGDLAAAKDGERGLLASDLMPYLRRLVNNR